MSCNDSIYFIIQAYIVHPPDPVVTAGAGDTNYVNVFCSWLKYTIEFSICYLLGNIFIEIFLVLLQLSLQTQLC